MGASKNNGIRAMAPFQFFNAFVQDMQKDHYRRGQLAMKWIQEDRKVTPEALKFYEDMNKLMGSYTAPPSNNDIVFVANTMGFPKVRRRVNIADKTCTCEIMWQFKIPCYHYCAALNSLGRLHEVWDHFGTEYKVTTYADMYVEKPIHLPIDGEYELDLDILPAATEAPKRGRPKKTNA
jgi:hypothetical protein